jgi:hypothetical protein
MGKGGKRKTIESMILLVHVGKGDFICKWLESLDLPVRRLQIVTRSHRITRSFSARPGLSLGIPTPKCRERAMNPATVRATC